MGVRGYVLLEKFEIVCCQRCDFTHFGGQSFTENKLFMIHIKLDVASSAVSPFQILFSV